MRQGDGINRAMVNFIARDLNPEPCIGQEGLALRQKAASPQPRTMKLLHLEGAEPLCLQRNQER